MARARGRRDDAIPCPGARSSEECLQSAGASPLLAALSLQSKQEGLGPSRGRRTRAGLCVRGGRWDPLCAQLPDPDSAAVPAEESQRGRRAVRAL